MEGKQGPVLLARRVLQRQGGEELCVRAYRVDGAALDGVHAVVVDGPQGEIKRMGFHEFAHMNLWWQKTFGFPTGAPVPPQAVIEAIDAVAAGMQPKPKLIAPKKKLDGEDRHEGERPQWRKPYESRPFERPTTEDRPPGPRPVIRRSDRPRDTRP